MEQTAADKKNTSAAGGRARAQDLLANKDFNGALAVLDGILEENAEDAAAQALAGDVYAAAGDAAQAVGYYGLAVQTAPETVDYKRKFINAAGNMDFTQYNPVIEQILRLCLEAPEIECAHAQTLWYTLVRSHPQIQALLKLKAILALSPLSAASNTFDKAADISFLLQPIFLLGVKRIVVCNEEFEEFMTELRRFLLEQMDAPKRKLRRNNTSP